MGKTSYLKRYSTVGACDCRNTLMWYWQAKRACAT